MKLSETLIKALEHPLLTAFAEAIKKFRHTKSYWGVISLVIVFIFREALAASYGDVIKTFMTTQANGSDYAWLWNILAFILGEGGNWGLVALGCLIFIVLSLVSISENKNNTISLKESILSLVLLLSIIGTMGYSLSINNAQHNKTHTVQEITQTKLDEIKALIKLQGGDETAFLIKYFGINYSIILENPKTYHNFSTLLTQTHKTADELLKERETILKKISSQKFSEKLQQEIDKAFSELRYEDARALMDAFLEANHDKEQAIIKAHYIKALSYMEQIRYPDAKNEFEYIGFSVNNTEILSDYAFMYYILSEYDKAITFYEKALKVRIVTLGEKHPSTAASYNNIGTTNSKGEFNKAITFYEKALKIELATIGENQSITATSYGNIGLAWHNKGKFDKAIKFHTKALNIKLATLGDNNPSTATTYNNIGLALTKNGRHDKALSFYMKALNIRLTTLEENHPDIANSYNNIGGIWKSKGEYDKAITFYEKALRITFTILGENHPDTATYYNNIGSAWNSKGEYKKAKLYYEKALKVLGEIFPSGHPYIDITKLNLRNTNEKLIK